MDGDAWIPRSGALVLMQYLPPEKAWWVIGVFVVAFDAITPEGATLSEKMDDWIDNHPVLTRAGVLLVAAHLCNFLSPRLDPIHLTFVGLGTLKRRTMPRFFN